MTRLSPSPWRMQFASCFVLSIVLVCSTAFCDPPTGSAPEPVADPAPAAGTPKTAALRTGPAAPAAGYFSPLLGVRFELVQIQIAGRGLVDGAKLLDEPVVGSPLAGKGLVAGDLITHLDGDPILQESELEAHSDSTVISWIPDQARTTRDLTVFIQPGKRFIDPARVGPNGGNGGNAGPPQMKFSDIDGSWNCTCGGVWTLSQNGNVVTGDETDPKNINRVSGDLNGRTFSFTYTHQAGYSGVGTFNANPTFTTMTGTIRWKNGTTSTPTLTRVIAFAGPIPNPRAGATKQYSVVALQNKSNEFIDCELRWNGRGNWQSVTLKPRQSWTFWMEGTGHKPQTRLNFDRTGGQDVQVVDLSSRSVAVQGDPTVKDAAVTNINVIGGFIGITQ